MDHSEIRKLQKLTSFEALVDYLRDELDWPIEDTDQTDRLAFEYSPAELGLDEKSAVKIHEIRQLRPLVDGQPWGIFWVDFEPKKLPISVMRRILNGLVTKQRNRNASQATWHMDDLLFISAVGDEKTEKREINFAHFHQDAGDLPTLRVLGWDGADTVLKIDYVAKTLKEKLLWPQNPKDVQGWRETWAEAFKHKPGHVIRTADALAARLAELAGKIRAAAVTIMEHESERGRLRKLHKAFQTALIHDLTQADFADTYAQTITYGLLTAAISRTDMLGGEGGTALVAENITDMVPVTNPFLKEMLGTFLHAGGRSGNGRNGIDFDELGIQDVVELLRSNETDLPAILRDFNNRAEGEDPVIRFYEDFLEAYDKELKVQRGVFYTPKPVVSYIVRGVHELLQSEFGLEDGLAATVTWGEMHARNAEVKIPKGVAASSFFVMILDPATGTATFLVEVIDVIYKTMVAKWKTKGLSAAQIQAAWNEYVPTSLLPRLYGYELMMAPYAIAHMKIGLKLFETGYRFASDQRANIYLTNALDEPSQLAQGSAASLFEALGHESQAVNDVKRGAHFTVVIGNPPYANFGMMNKGEWILGLLGEYKQGLDEKKINLDDDFIKFVRLAQWTIDKSNTGIIGFITNNSYIDGLTHRAMRGSLLNSFGEIHVLDLHGSTKRQSAQLKDENVFDIQQGVAICFMAKSKDKKNEGKVFHAELFDTRERKYETLLANSLASFHWIEVQDVFHESCLGKFLFFAPKAMDNIDEYCMNWSLKDIFSTYQNGIKTDRDELFFDMDASELEKRMKTFYSKKGLEKSFAEKYRVENSSSYDLISRRSKTEFEKENIRKCLYRPFDEQYLYYAAGLTSRPAWDVMQHMLAGKNLSLLSCRQQAETGFQHVFCTDSINECCAVSLRTREITSAFPLYIYPSGMSKQQSLFTMSEGDRRPNFTDKFSKALSKTIKLSMLADGTGDLHKTFGPEDVFHYMYAVFHNPTYRSRYAEFLKIDFPRLPLTSNVALFRQLCVLGKELVALHLLEAEGQKPKVKFSAVRGQSSVVAKGYPKYDDGKVYINTEAHFAGVPAEVWEFHIGGYQVCEKWLKDRRGRELSAEDIVHYQKIVVSLGETIRLMGLVDEAIESAGGWPVR
jgi:hypothetical protein